MYLGIQWKPALRTLKHLEGSHSTSPLNRYGPFLTFPISHFGRLIRRRRSQVKRTAHPSPCAGSYLTFLPPIPPTHSSRAPPAPLSLGRVPTTPSRLSFRKRVLLFREARLRTSRFPAIHSSARPPRAGPPLTLSTPQSPAWSFSCSITFGIGEPGPSYCHGIKARDISLTRTQSGQAG